jgi:HKD family nuclease
MSVKCTNPQSTLLHEIEQQIQLVRPTALGIVSAFVSLGGVERLANSMNSISDYTCRIVAGTCNFVTHPEALYRAVDLGWDVRLGHSPPKPAIFHPKLIVAGKSFSQDNHLTEPSFSYIGSANLTDRGLTKNSECGCVDIPARQDCSQAIKSYWEEATVADQTAIDRYAAAFADRNRKRKPIDLDELGISDWTGQPGTGGMRDRTPPTQGMIRPPFAAAAWAGLQSFTGEFQFQIEFPRAAGEVLQRMIAGRTLPDNFVEVFCEADGRTIAMKYRFYENNSMFRLNVPNEVAGVEWARQNRDGIVLVERGPEGGAPIRLKLLRPGNEVQEVEERSGALDTWGMTPTRFYGWY